MKHEGFGNVGLVQAVQLDLQVALELFNAVIYALLAYTFSLILEKFLKDDPIL